MRKWTKSACVVVALGIGLLLAVIGFGGSAHAAQAKTSIASISSSSGSGSRTSSSSRTSSRTSSSGRTSSSRQAGPGAPAGGLTAAAAPATAGPAVTWAVRPGDTLAGIAAALGVRGGWPALYAVNRRVVGPDPGLIRPGMVLAVPGGQRPLSYTVAPGDTLSAVAAALGLRGGWSALYAVNRRVVGPDPDLIRPGMVLAVPGRAASGKAPGVLGTGPGSGKAPSEPSARGGQPHRPAAGGTPGTSGTPATGGTPAVGGLPAVSGSASPAGLVPATGTGSRGLMPRWLKATLLAVAALVVASFVAQPAVTAARRRQAARARAALRRKRRLRAAGRAGRIVQADHERLIITYSISDDTVYVLTPPGEDPRAVLRAARLVVPEENYQDLADHLGVPSGWQRE